MQKETYSILITRYLASLHNSTCILTYFSWSVLKTLLLNVTCLDDPLSTYHPTIEMVLVAIHDTMENIVLSLDDKSSTPEVSTLLQIAYVICSFPSSSWDTKTHSGPSWNITYDSRISSYARLNMDVPYSSFPHLTDEGLVQDLIISNFDFYFPCLQLNEGILELLRHFS
jgi:hypothetical protein